MCFASPRIGAALSILALLLLSACGTPLKGGPDRLEPVSAQTTAYRQTIPQWEKQYYTEYANLDEEGRKAVRNEIISQRMYIIDLQYTAYETGLTRDRQVVGFLTGTTLQGLSAAGTVIGPGDTTRILAGATTFVTGTKGYYDSEIIIARTVQLLQTQMRANRAEVSRRILRRFEDSTARYPLALAMTDLEEYYRAGTLTSGLLEAASTVAKDKEEKEAAKNYVVEFEYGPDANTEVLEAYLFEDGADPRVRAQILNGILKDELKYERGVDTILDDPGKADIRKALVEAARTKGIL